MYKLIVTLALLGGGLFLATKTNFGSYVETLWSMARRETADQVPTKFEIERARVEIANLDRDIANMLRPIAENKVAIAQLRREITRNETHLAEQGEALKIMMRDLDSNQPVLLYAGKEYSADRVKQIVTREFESFQRLEKHLLTQKKLLEAKERSLVGTQEQLTKISTKKREFEIRLAQLEAEHETLRVAAIGTSPVIDNTRANQIEESLKALEKRLEVNAAMIEMTSGTSAGEIPPVLRQPTPLDFAGMRDYLDKSPVCKQ